MAAKKQKREIQGAAAAIKAAAKAAAAAEHKRRAELTERREAQQKAGLKVQAVRGTAGCTGEGTVTVAFGACSASAVEPCECRARMPRPALAPRLAHAPNSCPAWRPGVADHEPAHA